MEQRDPKLVLEILIALEGVIFSKLERHKAQEIAQRLALGFGVGAISLTSITAGPGRHVARGDVDTDGGRQYAIYDVPASYVYATVDTRFMLVGSLETYQFHRGLLGGLKCVGSYKHSAS